MTNHYVQAMDKFGFQDDVSVRMNRAIKNCKSAIQYYNSHKYPQLGLYYASQLVAIVVGSISAVLVGTNYASSSPEGRVALAIVTALGPLMIALNKLFKWHDNGRRNAYTEQVLRLELEKLETRGSKEYHIDLKPEDVLRNFVQRTETVLETELDDWKKLQETGNERVETASSSNE